MLSLAEELLLLALDDQKGTVPSSADRPLGYALPAAGLSELLLAGRLSLGEKNRVAVTDPTPLGDDILDEMLGRIRRSRRTKSLKDWVRDLGDGGIKKPRERLEKRLVAKGVLRAEEGRYLLLITWHHYPTVDGGPEAGTRERLRAVLLGGEEPDPRTAILVSLVKACDLLGRLFTRDERKQADRRAKEIAKGQAAGEAVSKAIEEANAVIAAISASSTTSITGATG